jgi:hypothetical protein
MKSACFLAFEVESPQLRSTWGALPDRSSLPLPLQHGYGPQAKQYPLQEPEPRVSHAPALEPQVPAPPCSPDAQKQTEPTVQPMIADDIWPHAQLNQPEVVLPPVQHVELEDVPPPDQPAQPELAVFPEPELEIQPVLLPEVMEPSPSEQSPPSADPEGMSEVPKPLTSLPELARVVRLQRYQAQRCHQLQRQLLDLQVATARTFRLATIASSIQRILAECIRTEDKATFLTLFTSFQRTLEGCTKNLTLPLEHDIGDISSAQSCLSQLPETSRASITDFLSQIHHNGNFIADRIASLTHKEILALLPDRVYSRLSESVLGSSSGNPYRACRHLGFIMDSQTELLETHAFASPLETLIHSMQGFSIRHGHDERRALEVWSTVCSRLIAEQKPGFEKLVPTVLDIWAASSPWPGKDRLQLWILQTLRAGSFLTEQPAKQTFRMRIQGRPEGPVEDQVKADRFYTQAVHGLLDLLVDPSGATVIPEPVLRMCHAIWARLGHAPDIQRRFPNFVVTRWLFSPHFFDATTLPEVSLSQLQTEIGLC